MEQVLFINKNLIITTHIVPCIMGIGCKTPEEAKFYIKHSETLNPLYNSFSNEDK